MQKWRGKCSEFGVMGRVGRWGDGESDEQLATQDRATSLFPTIPDSRFPIPDSQF
ncbi:MAG: hypothetical protein F6J90_17380 [Moorea sp. SIOASIH]|nr:hypothetical protein [Moorena sp. SIOASIH]